MSVVAAHDVICDALCFHDIKSTPPKPCYYINTMKENDFFPFLARLVYDLGVDESRTIAVAMILYSTVIVLSALGTWFFTRHIINAGIYRWVKKTHVKWDDALADHKVLAPMSLFVPIIILGA